MKTITEFFGKNLRDIQAKIPDWNQLFTLELTHQLTQEGKSLPEIQEQLPALLKTKLKEKIGAELKFEGDKLDGMMAALDLVKTDNRSIKRVLLLSLLENEKKPEGQKDLHEIDGKIYQVECFQEPQKTHQRKEDDRFSKRGGGRDKKGRGGRDRNHGSGDRNSDRSSDRGGRRFPEAGRSNPAFETAGAVDGRERQERPARKRLSPEEFAALQAKRAEERAARAAAREAKVLQEMAKEPLFDGKNSRIMKKSTDASVSGSAVASSNNAS